MNIKESIAGEYENLIGYNPFDDDPTLSIEEVQQILNEYKAEIS